MTFSQRSRQLRFAITLLVLAAFAQSASAEKVEQLKPTNFVNDFAGVLDAATQAQLNSLCLEIQQKTKAEVAIVTIKSLEDRPVEDFAVDLFKRWGVGGKTDNRGVLVLLSTGDRKYRVEVGYGLEPILPDGKVGGFGREMVPILRQGNYGAAITLLTTRIAQTIAQDANVQITGIPPRSDWRDNKERQSEVSRIIVYAFGIILFLLFLWHPSLFFWMLMSVFGGGDGGGRRSGGGFGGGGDFGGFGGGSSGGGGASGSW